MNDQEKNPPAAPLDLSAVPVRLRAPDPKQTCDQCDYWRRLNRVDDSAGHHDLHLELGLCKRHAPESLIPYPKTVECDGCGQWQSNQMRRFDELTARQRVDARMFVSRQWQKDPQAFKFVFMRGRIVYAWRQE